MIFNLSAGDNTSEEVEVMLTELESEINTLMAELKSDVESMITNLTNTINNSSIGAVKSIQRGSVVGTPNKTTEVTINAVNPDKCLVLLSVSEIGGEGYNYLPNVYSLTSNKLTITETYISFPNSNNETTISWQVVEFY